MVMLNVWNKTKILVYVFIKSYIDVDKPNISVFSDPKP